MTNFSNWNPNAKLIIYDDWSDFNYFQNPKGLLTQAGECTITDKYVRKLTVNFNMPAIYLNNDMPKDKYGIPLNEIEYWNNVNFPNRSNGIFVSLGDYDRLY